MVHLFQLKKICFTFLTDGKIKTEKYSDQFLKLKKQKEDLACVLWNRSGH